MRNPKKSPSRAGRSESPLCNTEFRKPSSDLRPTTSPRWMGLGLAGSIAGAILVGALVLLNPMEEFVEASGVVGAAGMDKDDPRILILHAARDRMGWIRLGQRVRFRKIIDPDLLAPMGGGIVSGMEERGSRESRGEFPAQSVRPKIQVQVESVPSDLAIGEGVEAEIVIGSRPMWQLLLHRSGNHR